SGRLLYTLRSRSYEGRFEGSLSQRRSRLLRAGQHYDLVDLEADHDLSVSLLEHLPCSKRLLSWYGPAPGCIEPEGQSRWLFDVGARYYKVVYTGSSVHDELCSLRLLNNLKRRDTVAYGIGATGSWSRLLAPFLGAPCVFGVVGEAPVRSGEFTVA